MTEFQGLFKGTDWDGNDHAVLVSVKRALVVMPYGKYYEATKRGILFHASTPDGGVAPGTDLTSTTPPVSLYNPNGSGVDLVIVKARLAYVSGTLGAGDMYWVANTNPAAAATTGTALTIVNGKLGSGAGQAKPLHTATIPAAGTLARVFGSLDASLATTAGMFHGVLEDDVDGALIASPGCTISLLADAATGSTPLVAISLTWIEVPV